MNLSNKSFLTSKDSKLTVKSTSLNPNAAEFVPSALRLATVSTNSTDVTRTDATGTSGKAIFNRSESSISNNSDDEVHQFWRRQLPDDITPDFKVSGDDMQGTGSLSLAGLSIHDNYEASRLSAMASSAHLLSKQPNLPAYRNEDIALSEKMRYSIPSYAEHQSVDSFLELPTDLWDKQFMNGNQHFTNGQQRRSFNGDSSGGYLNDLLNENTVLDESEVSPVDFLALQFPGFASESLAEVYYANECDLNSTIEMLTQLELQVDGLINQNLTAKTQAAPSLTSLDFPALAPPDSQNGLTKFAGDEIHQATNPYLSVEKDNLLLFKSNSSGLSRGATDFASAVRKIASQDSGQWKYERNGSHDISASTSRSSRGGLAKAVYGDRLQGLGARAAPVWVETGEAVANMYSELREEARDHARLRNVYFEQARQAYLIGNKALAKELSVKGHLHNMRMKEAHGKAKDSIYRQRNPVAPELQSYTRGQDPLIDLHGLHVSEAIHMLKLELSALRNTVRATGQPLPVLICVGTGHHTKGSRTPARLPVAVERFLVEEGLEYNEPQPGLLRIVLY